MSTTSLRQFDPQLREPLDEHLADVERFTARRRLTQSEKVLSGLIYEHVDDLRALRRIHTKGDQALFGGVTTRRMKKRLGVPKGRALGDFLPTLLIQARDFANQLTNYRIKRSYLHTEAQITREHIKNNREVRKLLQKRKIEPEDLPAAEDVRKVERRLSMEKELSRQATQLATPEKRPATP